MKTLHAKSPCCLGKIYHYGSRRRQCSICKLTWRIRQKKRGRKHYRINKNLLNKTFIQGQPLKFQLRKNYPSMDVLYKRFHQSLVKLCQRSKRYSFAQDDLILLGDGLWFKFEGKDWVLYVAVLKSVNNSQAVILDPLLLSGKESAEGWKQVIEKALPKSAKKQVVAFISDNFRGSSQLAKGQGWIHQLCHFHLLARLQVVRGKRKINLSYRNIREKVYQNIRLALKTTDSKELELIKRRLRRWVKHPNCPRKIGLIAREFLRRINCFRAYLNYPEFNLPATTNSIESLNTKIRQATRKLKTAKAVQIWATALVRILSTITCNGKNFQPN